MRRFMQFAWLEAKLYFRQVYSPFFAIVFPVMMLLLFGAIWGNVPSEFFSGFGSADVTTATATGIVIAVNGVISLPITLTSYRSRKILKRLRATPISPSLLLSAQVVVNLIMTALGIVFLIVVGMIAFGVRGHGNTLEIVAAIALSMASISSMGLVLASVVPTEKAAELIGNLIYFPMIFLSGSTLPAQLFPAGLRTFSRVFPLTHAVNLIKGIWLGGHLGDYPVALIVLGSTTIVFTIIAALTFRWE
jgi:ABC-2 type transport system permease protein